MLLQLLLNIAEVFPPDGGPLYAETNLNNFVAEPWNAYSSLTFLLPVIYWFVKLRKKYKDYPFLIACMPLLTLGGIGSTIYHAFRDSYFFLLMDVLPIAAVTLAVSLYFWSKSVNRWEYVAIIGVVFIGLKIFIAQEVALAQQQAINLNYFITGMMIFIPAFLLLLKTHYKGTMVIITATAFFILSLIFRQIDTPFLVLPMGTHWLWHTCCAIGAFFLAKYLYLVASLDLQKVNA
jgi:hemolysin III